MGNLGGFAGGLARGIETGTRLNMQQEELTQNKEFRDRQMKLQEAQGQREQERFQQEKELQDAMKGLHKKYGYGEQEVEDPTGSSLSEDAAGNIVRIPKMVKKNGGTFGDGTNVARDLAFMSEATMLRLQKTGDPSHLAQAGEYVRKLRGDEFGRKLLAGITSGDPTQLGEAVKSVGGDPAKVAFVKGKDGRTMVDVGNGHTIPLNWLAYIGGADGLLGFNREEEKGDLTRSHVLAQNEDLAAHTGLVKEEAKLQPKKGNLIDAQTAEAYAGAKYKGARANAAAAGANGLAVPKVVADQVRAATLDPTTGKTNSSAYAYVLGRVAGSKNPAAEIAAAQTDYDTALKSADAFVRKLKKDKNLRNSEKFKGLSDDQIRLQTLTGMLGPVSNVSVAAEEEDK